MIPLLREIRFFKELAKAIYLTSFFSVFESVWKKFNSLIFFEGRWLILALLWIYCA